VNSKFKRIFEVGFSRTRISQVENVEQQQEVSVRYFNEQQEAKRGKEQTRQWIAQATKHQRKRDDSC
jgi:hypothetical protein